MPDVELNMIFESMNESIIGLFILLNIIFKVYLFRCTDTM